MRGFCGAWRCIALSLVLLSYFLVYENLIVVERNPTSTDSEAGATPVIETTATRLDFSQSSVGIGGMVGDGGSIGDSDVGGDVGGDEAERDLHIRPGDALVSVSDLKAAAKARLNNQEDSKRAPAPLRDESGDEIVALLVLLRVIFLPSVLHLLANSSRDPANPSARNP